MDWPWAGAHHRIAPLPGSLTRGRPSPRYKHIMKLTFCGAAGTTTGSQHLLEVNGQKILLDEGRIPRVSIFVDSPLAVDATKIFRLHPECFNEEVYEFLFTKRNPFHFDGLTLIRSAEQSRALNTLKKPAIIIATSGMCEAGRVLHHLKNNLDDPGTTVLFVGYCAEQTLGWKLREGFREVNVLGERVRVRARIETLDSFSGHADHSELLRYYQRLSGRKEQT